MEMCSSPSVDEKVGKELNTLPGVSKHCSSQNHLQDGGTVYALKSFLGSGDSQHEVVCPRVRAGDGGWSSGAEVPVCAGDR